MIYCSVCWSWLNTKSLSHSLFGLRYIYIYICVICHCNYLTLIVITTVALGGWVEFTGGKRILKPTPFPDFKAGHPVYPRLGFNICNELLSTVNYGQF